MNVTRRIAILSATASMMCVASAQAKVAVPLAIRVYKDPECDCCGAWADHLKASGFKVEVEPRADLTALEKKLGVPDDLASCHTGVIAGYAIEGHVPADDIKRFIAAHPKALGLAVPGMPVNSPGMEAKGEPTERYTVWQFNAGGMRSPFATHG